MLKLLSLRVLSRVGASGRPPWDPSAITQIRGNAHYWRLATFLRYAIRAVASAPVVRRKIRTDRVDRRDSSLPKGRPNPLKAEQNWVFPPSLCANAADLVGFTDLTACTHPDAAHATDNPEEWTHG